MLSDAQRQRMTDTQAQREAYLRLRSEGFEPESAGFEPVRSGRLALHPLMVIFPSAAFLVAVVFDALYLVSGAGGWATWASGVLFVGLLSSLPAVVVGAADWLRVTPRTRTKSLATWHALTNLTALGLFLTGWLVRLGSPAEPGFGSTVLIWSGTAILILGGVLGGELATRLAVQLSDPTVEEPVAVPDVAVIVPVEPVAEERQVAQA